MNRSSVGGAEAALPSTHWRRYRRVRTAGHDDVLDEVVVGPSGVHVVLDRPGSSVGDPEVATVAEAAAAVVAQLPSRYHARVHPELRLGDDAGDVAVWHDGVLLASPHAMEHVWRHGPRQLSTSEIAEVSRWLDVRLERVVTAPPATARRWWMHLRRSGR